MIVRRPPLPAGDRIAHLVESLLPGKSPSVIRLRQQILDFSANVSARTVLLHGPIGAGKSTVARAIGFLKRIAPLAQEEVERHIRNLRFDGPGRIDIKLMPWYLELSLTGLVESLAERQLFGIGKKKATDVEEGPGIFETAANGRFIRDETGSKVTGGVVFLDEIGDLTAALQAKLLPVLSGGVFYRVGEEADPKGGRPYEGVTATASWQKLDGRLRPDLLSRVSEYVIQVPGVADRPDDFTTIVESMEAALVEEYKARIERLCTAEPGVDRAYWRHRLSLVRPIDEGTMRLLASASWDRLGNLRGLTAAVQRIVIGGEGPRLVLETLPVIAEGPGVQVADSKALLSRLLSRPADGSGLAQHVRTLEIEDRRRLRALLAEDGPARAALAQALGVEEDRLVVQIQQLDRTRGRAAGRRRT
jgi:DNA-binding NtrC family response regulator